MPITTLNYDFSDEYTTNTTWDNTVSIVSGSDYWLGRGAHVFGLSQNEVPQE